MSNLNEKKSAEDVGSNSSRIEEHDVFGSEHDHDIQYKTLSWQVCNTNHRIDDGSLTHIQFVAFLMIAEIVSNGMLSLPNAMAAVGVLICGLSPSTMNDMRTYCL